MFRTQTAKPVYKNRMKSMLCLIFGESGSKEGGNPTKGLKSNCLFARNDYFVCLRFVVLFFKIKVTSIVRIVIRFSQPEVFLGM